MMEREQIMKAWEDVAAVGKEVGLSRSSINYVSISLVNDTLALIKELIEENEKLRTVADMSDATLTDALRIVGEFCDKRIKPAKADTVRKMQERLKAELNNAARVMTRCGNEYFVIGKSFIDRIAEEMLEGEK